VSLISDPDQFLSASDSKPDPVLNLLPYPRFSYGSIRILINNIALVLSSRGSPKYQQWIGNHVVINVHSDYGRCLGGENYSYKQVK
jgi:hypothetical protein